MSRVLLDHYLEYGKFTYPGLYQDHFRSLPSDIRKIGHLLRWSFVHRTTLENGNKLTNKDMKFGDMSKVPWYRQAEDDDLVTTSAIIAELFRRDQRGIVFERKVEDKVILTCRYITILMASILKSKNIPCRVRSGFAGYWPWTKASSDHWINQYWSKEKNRWVTIDIDGSFHDTGFDMYDIPEGKFEYSADAWLNVRQGKINEKLFWNADGNCGLIVLAWELFYDFHCLMNNEIHYFHHPKIATLKEFKRLSENQLKDIDHLAKLMIEPDVNFKSLVKIWNTKKEYRLLTGGLL